MRSPRYPDLETSDPGNWPNISRSRHPDLLRPGLMASWLSCTAYFAHPGKGPPLAQIGWSRPDRALAAGKALSGREEQLVTLEGNAWDWVDVALQSAVTPLSSEARSTC